MVPHPSRRRIPMNRFRTLERIRRRFGPGEERYRRNVAARSIFLGGLREMRWALGLLPQEE